MKAIFMDKDGQAIESKCYIERILRDENPRPYQWYRQGVIYQFMIEEDKYDGEDIIYAQEYFINIEKDIPILKPSVVYYIEELSEIFDLDFKIGFDGTIDITITNQKVIREPIKKYLFKKEAIVNQEVEITINEYDRNDVKLILKIMKDCNIKEYSYDDNSQFKYHIIQDNGIFYIIEDSRTCWGVTKFKIKY